MSDRRAPESRWRVAALYLLALAYGLAGLAHLAYAPALARIVPPFVPEPEGIVLVTGLCELAGAAGLLIPRFRRAAGWAFAAYALCVWPANMYHALLDWRSGTGLPMAYHAVRLPLQIVIIAWTLWATGILRVGRRR